MNMLKVINEDNRMTSLTYSTLFKMVLLLTLNRQVFVGYKASQYKWVSKFMKLILIGVV